ncbi:MAG: hypothetical protein LBP50_02615, partial [Tannerella sp.]|nr:hypothetical protein [Tannerella sp.]
PCLGIMIATAMILGAFIYNTSSFSVENDGKIKPISQYIQVICRFFISSLKRKSYSNKERCTRCNLVYTEGARRMYFLLSRRQAFRRIIFLPCVHVLL